MRILIAEDDFASRKFLNKLLSQYGECDFTVDGIETVEAFLLAHDMGKPYDLICLDIMMPKIDGLGALQTIRQIEKEKRVSESKKTKVIITSALGEDEVAFDSFSTGKETYITKPIDVKKLVESLKSFALIDSSQK